MNFRIVESDYTKEFNEQYDKIKQDINDGLKIQKIKEKYNLTDGKWRKYYKQLITDGLLTPRANSPKKAKYYTYNKGKYVVQKFKGRTKHHIGIFYDAYDAEKCVRLMKQNNWDFNKSKQVVEQVKKESNHKYYGVDY